MKKSKSKKKIWKPRAAIYFGRNYIPNTFEDILEQIFPNHKRRQAIALFLINKLKKAPIPAEEWILTECEYLIWEAENIPYSTINKEKAEELFEYAQDVYNDLEISNTKRNKLIMTKAEELGLNLSGINTQFWIVKRVLNDLRIIYKKDRMYYLSKRGFSKLLKRIADIAEDYLLGINEECEEAF